MDRHDFDSIEKVASQDNVVMQFITFTVHDQEYAIEITTIREIKGWSNTTSLPNTPAYMRGVINLRGAVVPILDLRCRFGLGLTQASKNNVVMIVRVADRVMGILADAVSDIINVSSDEIRPIPSIDLTDGNNTVLQGIVNTENRMVAILSLDRVFDHTIDILDGHIPEGVLKSNAEDDAKQNDKASDVIQ